MSAGGLIGSIFLFVTFLLIVGEWVRRDLKSRFPTPAPAETPSATRPTR